MKKKSLRMVVVLLLFAIMLVPFSEMETYAATNNNKAVAKVKKPAQVKNLKKVNVSTTYDKKGKRNISSAKIKFSKVKGASGYQVLVYRTNKLPGGKTPLVYAFNTKKTTYTVKNLVPAIKYTIKVRAYKKDKNGVVYAKTKSLKIIIPGKRVGCYFACNDCGAIMPGNSNIMCKHFDSAYAVCNELHASGTFNIWK